MTPYDPLDGARPVWRPRTGATGADADYAIEHGGAEKHGINGRLGMSVLGPGSRIWKRRAIKRAGTPQSYGVTWLVGELDGVRAYAVVLEGRTHVVLTRQDLYP